MTTQHLQEAEELADQVALLDLGKIVAKGSVDDIKKSLELGTILLSIMIVIHIRNPTILILNLRIVFYLESRDLILMKRIQMI